MSHHKIWPIFRIYCALGHMLADAILLASVLKFVICVSGHWGPLTTGLGIRTK